MLSRRPHFLCLHDPAAASEKWAHYFDIYDRHFSRFRGTNVKVVEIGVNNGGSLLLWRRYFGERATIVGVDLFDVSFMQGNPLYGSPNVMLNGDQATDTFWDSLEARVPHVDIIIDDGGHQISQQRKTLERALPLLQPGGVWLCEDIVFWKEPSSIVRKARRLRTLDLGRPVRSEPCACGQVAEDFLTGAGGLMPFKWSGHLRQTNLTEAQAKLFGVSVYPQVIVLEKLKRSRNILRPVASAGKVKQTGTRPKGTRMG